MIERDGHAGGAMSTAPVLTTGTDSDAPTEQTLGDSTESNP
jgi:hypothetical protein